MHGQIIVSFTKGMYLIVITDKDASAQDDQTQDTQTTQDNQTQNTQTQEQRPEPQKTRDSASVESFTRKRRRKKHPGRAALRTIIALVVIAVGIYLILYFIAMAAKYDTIPAMLQSMGVELSLMWQRISN